MRLFITGVVTTLLLAAAAGYLIVISGGINPGADQPTPDFEKWAAKTSLRAYLKRETPAITNPLAADPDNLRAGAKLYLNNCAVCHGFSDAKRSTIAEGLYLKPPIFKPEDDWSHDKDGKVYWFIDHGVRLTGMPSYHNTLSEKEIWQLVTFIKNMKKLPPDVNSAWQSVKPFEVKTL